MTSAAAMHAIDESFDECIRKRSGRTRWTWQARRMRSDATHCAICGKLFAPRIEGDTHPLARTLDHIVPRAIGGGDELGNIRVVHLRCNGLRGDGKDELIHYWRKRARAAERSLVHLLETCREEPE
jgi:5-methylcytosine-specific restriction endonuclease McrA